MRKRLSLIIGAFVVAVPLSANAEIVTSGLTNRWKIDQGSGTTALDSVGTADGQFVNSPTWTTDTPGIYHPPYALDFEADDSDYLHCQNDSVPTSSAGTIDTWFEIESWPDNRMTLFAKGPTAHWRNIYLGVIGNATADEMLLVLANGTSSTTTGLSTGPISLDTWYHMAGTWDGTNEYVYLNGVQVDSGSYGITPPNTLGYKVDIGYGQYGPRHFDGIIDEIRIYNRALTPEEVFQNYATVAVPEPASLVLIGAALCGLLPWYVRRRAP